MECWSNLKNRGLIFEKSDERLFSELKPGDAFYIGFDPTAPYLQIGNLVPLVVSLHLARSGLKPIILFGGATGAIGDPSGRNEERKLLPRETIDANIARQSSKVREIFGRVGVEAKFVNNFDWTKDVTIIDFLRDVGKHFTVNYMLAKEVIKARLSGEGISFTEFSYMLLQSFDFLNLFENHGCRMQIGGSDQWGNITSGLELIRKKIQKEAFAFCFPLITNSEGQKFSKSERGAIWLDTTGTSAYRFHQFWLNQDDKDVIRYLKIFSFLSEDEIASLEDNLRAAPEKREAQKRLADEICTLVHGNEATEDAKRCAQVLFGGDVSGMNDQQLEEIFSDVPSKSIPKGDLETMTAVDLFAASGASASKGEARRLISGGGAYCNSTRVEDPAKAVSELLREDSKLLILRSGKKNYYLIRAE